MLVTRSYSTKPIGRKILLGTYSGIFPNQGQNKNKVWPKLAPITCYDLNRIKMWLKWDPKKYLKWIVQIGSQNDGLK